MSVERTTFVRKALVFVINFWRSVSNALKADQSSSLLGPGFAIGTFSLGKVLGTGGISDEALEEEAELCDKLAVELLADLRSVGVTSSLVGRFNLLSNVFLRMSGGGGGGVSAVVVFERG
jgi:hypothetical protein